MYAPRYIGAGGAKTERQKDSTATERVSVRASDACRCMAVVLPLIREGQRWVEDCTRSDIVLVPLLSLGQHVLASPSTGVQQHSLAMSAALKAAGGAVLSGSVLHAALFSSAVMTAVSIDMMEMKVSELKEELEARGKGRTGKQSLATAGFARSDRRGAY